MNVESPSSWQAWQRGSGWRDRAAIVLFSVLLSPSRGLLKSRPRARALIANLAPVRWFFSRHSGVVCLRLRTRSGMARLVFDLLDDNECVVAEELLFEPIYLVDSPCELFVDAGAFRGISTVFLQDQAGASRVVAIEPGRKNHSELQRRLGVLLPIAAVHRAAAGASEGVAEFSGEGIGGRLKGDEDESAGAAEKVSVVKISHLADIRSAASVLLKMDIEGAETEVLPGLLADFPPRCTILLETHQTEEEAEGLIEILRREGFVAERLRSRPDWHSQNLFIDWKLERGAETISSQIP
jgi:FkbM family methyltransferase